MNRQELEQEAMARICPCYFTQLQNILSEATDQTLLDIIEDSFVMHDETIDPRDDCPMWLQERAEWLGEMQMEMDRGN